MCSTVHTTVYSIVYSKVYYKCTVHCTEKSTIKSTVHCTLYNSATMYKRHERKCVLVNRPAQPATLFGVEYSVMQIVHYSVHFTNQSTLQFAVYHLAKYRLQCQVQFIGGRKRGVPLGISPLSQPLGCLGTVYCTVQCAVQCTVHYPVQLVVQYSIWLWGVQALIEL